MLRFRLFTHYHSRYYRHCSTEVHTNSHETAAAADLVPPSHYELLRLRLRLQVQYEDTTTVAKTMILALGTSARVPDLHAVPDPARIASYATTRLSIRFIRRTSLSPNVMHAITRRPDNAGTRTCIYGLVGKKSTRALSSSASLDAATSSKDAVFLSFSTGIQVRIGTATSTYGPWSMTCIM